MHTWSGRKEQKLKKLKLKLPKAINKHGAMGNEIEWINKYSLSRKISGK